MPLHHPRPRREGLLSAMGDFAGFLLSKLDEGKALSKPSPRHWTVWRERSILRRRQDREAEWLP